jgi:hypothetical protein
MKAIDEARTAAMRTQRSERDVFMVDLFDWHICSEHNDSAVELQTIRKVFYNPAQTEQ